jgi:hypothetical protein
VHVSRITGMSSAETCKASIVSQEGHADLWNLYKMAGVGVRNNANGNNLVGCKDRGDLITQNNQNRQIRQNFAESSDWV